MAFQVALLSSEEHCEYIRSVAERLELPFELDYKAYDRTRELPAFFFFHRGPVRCVLYHGSVFPADTEADPSGMYEAGGMYFRVGGGVLQDPSEYPL